ncbi:hypothetical protein PsYK624_084620 [Phanerochaete sordida]|uniref:Uncharacterized protein n=1 Tax=Phanerochaete sordida TaxID=48140 RepID=A0A9P3LF75_9APHY|nr:hypothetical protein PsYK624_084620 [Phanerochaete sordida]
MAGSYDWYRSNLPGWGSSQMRFREPPMPAFQPLPSWSGWDYYRAHAINPDQNLYYTVMNRTRDLGPTGGGDLEQARVWQRRVYSGLVDLGQLLPQDIGMAAAYEAYRMWKHHRPVLFDPLLSGGGPTGGMERVREGLVGLAIAEASRLWYYTNRAMDTYGLRDCLESAALTAFRISYTVLQEGAYAGGGYADPGYAGGGMPSPIDSYNDGYSGGYSRGRRGSFSGVASSLGRRSPSPFLGAGAGIPIPGRARSDSASLLGGSPYLGSSPSGYNAGLAPPAAGYAGGSYPGPGLQPAYGGGYPAGQPYAGPLAGMRAGVNTLLGGVTGTPGLGANVGPGSYNPAAGYGAAPGYAGTGYGGAYGGGYPASGQYGAAQPYAVPGGTAIPAPAGSTIVIKSRPRRHSHSLHHRSRSRDGRGEYRYEGY